MKLPNGEHSRVDREKVKDYLLSVTHPNGSGKAEFFTRFGFRLESWVVLADALRKHGANHPVAKSVESSYGTRYALEGELESPDGRNPRMRTIWIIERGTKIPRLITAYAIDDPL